MKIGARRRWAVNVVFTGPRRSLSCYFFRRPMHAYRRAIASAVALGIAFATMTPVSAYPMRTFGGGANPASSMLDASIPRVPGVRDFGRRNAAMPVRVTLTLNYNHQAELDQLVRNQSDRHSPLYHHFLTSQQFNNYFAPTPQQEARVLLSLRAAGFQITHVFPNRTLVGAQAPSTTVERFFNT